MKEFPKETKHLKFIEEIIIPGLKQVRSSRRELENGFYYVDKNLDNLDADTSNMSTKQVKALIYRQIGHWGTDQDILDSLGIDFNILAFDTFKQISYLSKGYLNGEFPKLLALYGSRILFKSNKGDFFIASLNKYPVWAHGPAIYFKHVKEIPNNDRYFAEYDGNYIVLTAESLEK